jgi:hypothetical protein
VEDAEADADATCVREPTSRRTSIHPPAATTSATPMAAITPSARRRDGAGASNVGACASVSAEPMSIVSSATASVSMVAKRSAGAFFIARATTPAMERGTPGERSTSGTGSRAMISATTRAALVVVHGGTPVSSSYERTPHANWSARPSRVRPSSCSGAM